MSAQNRVIVLGATGTVGLKACDILRRHSSSLVPAGFSAHSRKEALLLISQGWPECPTFLTKDPAQRDALLDFLKHGEYEICLNAIVGAAGLPFSEAVLKNGRTLALANKESLVMAGRALMQLAAQNGGRIIPVDSEHSAIHQCLAASPGEGFRTLYLTASGGALRDTPLDQFDAVTPAQALAHPNWDMGPRITIDSATMVNKAFEIVEAAHLFSADASQIKVLIHRQSVIHSMVEFHDGSLLAQMGRPDMAFPVHYALHWPHRVADPVLQGFDPILFSNLSLESPDSERFPALELAFEVVREGGASGAILNAADEVLVEAFLRGEVRFTDIVPILAEALSANPGFTADTIQDALAADTWAREFAQSICTRT
ncbi:MAG: 1-deoxy-D-xylulose-5-phosphate reductoisomerase [Planctomycetes bacterium]|jgi:1-deoxy-D-xylulose-5-phosphate reductoisomerase|nr:1-deoxy-D-xylulose-5-phosphate reductoisomerase [Planctomycetota bacterium]MBT4028450.1 1-deoxy-D-xylulose-5-phosphate reductoisomerase [Planctomycetota bacterium]MBT4559679.1 1-deoxy-D-xylulose-5-phosphate reductoisomerase [Planctomycetota bacterium]MBT5100740.1 1-deoxy-D-xylulose-5-phosphate reductoisomerase [Planctomycetota bacterium]MBT7011506.1 1-deoxy-D-xylulose-5-phosphate reductoisomerase [Planctomycetota bacterium]